MTTARKALALAGLLAAGTALPLVAPPAASGATNGRIAFVSHAAGSADIVTVAADGTDRRNLTAGSAAAETAPSWSVFSRRIAFASDRDGDMDIYTMAPDGTGVVQVTNRDGEDTKPVWSPDGTRLAFVSDRTGTRQVHTTTALPGGSVSLVTAGIGTVSDLAWSSAGRIAVTADGDGDRDVFAMNADGTGRIKVTHNAVDDRHPRWSGTAELVYASALDGDDFELVRIDADGTHLDRLTDDAVSQRHPVPSPDGQQMTWVHGSGDDREAVVGLDGAFDHALTDDNTVDEHPEWLSTLAIPALPSQEITSVVGQSLGTQVRVTFSTEQATDKGRVELWRGSTLAGFAYDPAGTARTTHDLTVSNLDPETSYTVTVSAPKRTGSAERVSATLPTPVRTLIRRVTITALDAMVHNDSDDGGCGEAWGRVGGSGVPTSVDLGDADHPQVICSGLAWHTGQRSITRDHVQDDQMELAAGVVEDDDNVLCICKDYGSGKTLVDLEAEQGAFTRTAAVEVMPVADSQVRVTFPVRYTVSYHL